MDRLIEDVLNAAALKTDRRALQRIIESAIEEMEPDWYSAQEILDVLIATLKSRYYEVETNEVEFRAERLKKAMQDCHEIDALEEEEMAKVKWESLK